MSEPNAETSSSAPETIRLNPGLNIMLATDLDNSQIYLPFNNDLKRASHPAQTITQGKSFIANSRDFPPPPVIDPDNLTEVQHQRIDHFLNQTNLPIILATHLALNTQDLVENWQFLPQPLPCLAIVGMAQVGKTTYSRALSQATNSPLIDTELFDPGRLNKHPTIRHALNSTCQKLQQRKILHEQEPNNYPLPQTIVLDANGKGWWDNRTINAFDYLSHGGAELRIHILTLSNQTEPRLIRQTQETGIKGLGPVGTSGLIYLQTPDFSKNLPQFFVNQVLNYQTPQGWSVVEFGQATRDAFIFGSQWYVEKLQATPPHITSPIGATNETESSIPKAELSLEEFTKQVRQDELIEVAIVSEKIPGVNGSGTVKKLQSKQNPNTSVAYKASDQQGDLRYAWGPEVWINGSTIPQREVAAFIVSDSLGLNFVPYTTLEEGPDGIGSFQLWIQGQTANQELLSTIDPYELVTAASFIHIIGGIDAHSRNLIISDDNRIHLIDNGLSFPLETTNFYRNYDITQATAGKTIPTDILALMKDLFQNDSLSEKGQSLKVSLMSLLSSEEVSAFFTRTKDIIVSSTIPRPF